MKIFRFLKNSFFINFFSSTTILDGEDRSENRKVTQRLRILFLTPLAITFIVSAFLLIQALASYDKLHLDEYISQIKQSFQRYYEVIIQEKKHTILSVMDSLEYSDSLNTLFEWNDREALYAHSINLFKKLNHQLKITHLYFIRPDNTVLLRVHAAKRYDDKISRATLRNAMQSKSVSSGVELGPLGTLTLRVVKPWYGAHRHKLIGYIEMGMEIDKIFSRLNYFYDSQFFVVIDKQYLKKDKWQSGMKALGRSENWNQFQSVILSSETRGKLPAIVTECLKKSTLENLCSHINGNGKASYRFLTMPIRNDKGSIIAKVLVVLDVRSENLLASKTIMVVSIVAGIGCILLLVLFYYLIGNVGVRLELDEKKLVNLATHDGLTKLYNHRTFYKLFRAELVRAKRYRHPLALLMIDIDYFKEVNDRYGHQVGDIVLEKLSELITREVRNTDLVCRYGGEEITVIMPETKRQEAERLAERLRASVESHVFVSTSKGHVSITVSIGVSFCSDDSDTAESLVSSVDTALYRAKNEGRNCVRS